MTNKEVLQADLLDIVFEHRNKDYGAYQLRRGYNRSMVIALSAGIGILLLLVFTAVAASKRDVKEKQAAPRQEGIVIRSVELPKVEIKQPEPAKKATVKKEIKKSVPKIAAIKYTTPPKIKKDTEVKEVMPPVSELDGKAIAAHTSDGKPADGTVLAGQTGTGTVVSTEPEPVQPVFTAEERDPLFPGGPEGLKQFMARNLGSPGYLDAGEKVVVQVRFLVDKDGSVSHIEIIKSGGDAYDREVVRVARKMPRWIPALQNGINVPVNYVLPITFIGTEG